jgi:histone-lysine N-methyltransferase SUV39H
VPCYINESNIDKPLLTVFARRDIEAGEELCFSYNGSYDDDDDDADDVSFLPVCHAIGNRLST